MQLFHFEFNEFYDGDFTYVKNGSYAYSRNYYVKNCFFENLNNRAVDTLSTAKFLFEDSTFVCVSHPSKVGGAVYSIKGEVVHNRICSLNCSTSYYGQYCYSEPKTQDSKNYVIDSTLLSSFKQPKGYAPLDFIHGRQYFANINISCYRTYNICGYEIRSGGLYTKRISKSNSTYNSIINNTAYYDYCFLDYSLPDVKIFQSNIIYNSVRKSLIYNYGIRKFIIEECNIIENSGEKIIHVVEGGKTTIINCFLSNNVSTYGSVSFNITFNEEIKINHLFVNYCQNSNIYHHQIPSKYTTKIESKIINKIHTRYSKKKNESFVFLILLFCIF